MKQPAILLLRGLHAMRVRPRLLLAFITGLLASVALPDYLNTSTRSLLTWDIGAGFYLVLALWMIFSAPLEAMQKRACMQDEGALVVLGMTIIAASASLAAIILELSGLKERNILGQGIHVLLVIGTFAISWLLVHVTFALHYAHLYYLKKEQTGQSGLVFPDESLPIYTDFLYFALVIGMTSQTADVGIASPQIRRLVMMQGLIAFVFNTSLLALTINIAAGLIN